MTDRLARILDQPADAWVRRLMLIGLVLAGCGGQDASADVEREGVSARQVADEAAAQYETLADDDLVGACMQAQITREAYRQAGEVTLAQQWAEREARDCAAAGLTPKP